ncbi:ABC transporter permease [Candidatus Woesearchaeota archaeon CG10_big_fil_rev_8_21_14_0_10_36_11]|nr:MAG: ABC transporter permease [Candidatus Woesearchaeota archaeon CG10_big_fil_rev_8_21_14_0_10_36_11]
MIKDYINIPWKEIRRRKVRSWLTLIGIFIGIATIVSLITLGQGLENAIEGQFSALGKDKLFITPKGGTFGMGSSEVLTEDDLDVIRQTSGVKRAAGMGTTIGRYEFNDIVRYNFVAGIPTPPEERALIGEAQTWHIEKGRSIEQGDKYKVLLGHEYTQTGQFEKALDLGGKININGIEFKVVGFLEKIGSPPDDKSGFIPLDTYAELYNKENELGYIIAQTQVDEDITKVADAVTKNLRKQHNVDKGKEDFVVETPEQLAATFAVILDIVQIVLIGIAGISLLVGGVGIMNTMYTSVLERTKEIGIMKALGARNSHIMALFLVESGIYGLSGGLIGAVIGIGFAKLVELVFIIAVGPAFLSIQIDGTLILGTLLFSFLVGCLSGIAPARRASKLHPVDSLRYE